MIEMFQLSELKRLERSIGFEKLTEMAEQWVREVYGVDKTSVQFDLQLSDKLTIVSNARNVKETIFEMDVTELDNIESIEVEKRFLIGSMVLGAAFKAEEMFHLMDDLPDNYKKRLESLTKQHQAFIRNVSTDDLIRMARNAPVSGVSFFQNNTPPE